MAAIPFRLRARLWRWPAAALVLALAACGGGLTSSGGGPSGPAYTYVVGGTFAVNEGTAAQPIALVPGTGWTGMVAGGTSYYRFTKSSGSAVAVQVTPDNFQPIQLQVLLTDQASFAPACSASTQTLTFPVPAAGTATFDTACGGGGLADGIWYLAITEVSGPATDYTLLPTTP
ncbi:MAG TPA: hypothetical protein VL359_01495 [bacterium]|nr:hypothetical protein [bacterium]